MKVAILYQSEHHGNTKKLLDALKEVYDVDLINVLEPEKYLLSSYDVIGIASGIAYGKFYPKITEIMESKLPKRKKVFFIYTCGSPRRDYAASVKQIAKDRNCKILGTYSSLGYDTYGPFKLIGGINKKNPSEAELRGIVHFYKDVVEKQ